MIPINYEGACCNYDCLARGFRTPPLWVHKGISFGDFYYCAACKSDDQFRTRLPDSWYEPYDPDQQ